MPVNQQKWNNETALVFLVAALIAASLAFAGWYQANAKTRELRIDELRPIAALLKEDQELLVALQADATFDKDSGILGSYLSKIRAEGVPKHAEMKQRLDQLAENNSAIAALISVYSSDPRTAAFSAEASKFVRYAIAWRDRWNSVMELFMAGGNYAVAEVPFPKEFLSAVQAEIEAAPGAF
jgi:hypothetical protein